MEPCLTCGNLYEGSFVIIRGARRYTFDCFECAAHATDVRPTASSAHPA